MKKSRPTPPPPPAIDPTVLRRVLTEALLGYVAGGNNVRLGLGSTNENQRG